jgi:hypothetical protein
MKSNYNKERVIVSFRLNRDNIESFIKLLDFIKNCSIGSLQFVLESDDCRSCFLHIEFNQDDVPSGWGVRVDNPSVFMNDLIVYKDAIRFYECDEEYYQENPKLKQHKWPPFVNEEIEEL